MAKRYSPDELPSRLENMTFSDYIQIIGDGRNWTYFEAAFGKGEWQRKNTIERLKQIRDLRNDVVHFRRRLGPEDEALLVARRDWLHMKSRAFKSRQWIKSQKLIPPVDKPIPSKGRWTELSFFQELERQCSPEETQVAKDILDWARRRMTRVSWGTGKTMGSFVPILNHKNRDHQVLAVWTGGVVEIYFQWYTYKPPFDAIEKRIELLQKLNRLPEVAISEDKISLRPSIPLSALVQRETIQGFLAIFDWVIEEIKAS